MQVDHELKQRIVGAAVITALAAIFVPMLFDDPLVESGKAVSELTIPEPPQIQEPEASEDVAAPDANGDTNRARTAEAELGSETLDSKDDQAGPAGMTAEEIAAEEEADRRAAERLAQELDAGHEEDSPAIKTLKDEGVERKSLSSTLKQAVTLEKKSIEKRFADKLAKDDSEDKTLVDKRPLEKLPKESSLLDKKQLEKELAERRAAEKMAQEALVLEKKAKEKALAEKLVAEKQIQLQAEEYRKLAEKKAKEKLIADKKAEEKAVEEEKLAAKQHALNDKDAAEKIAADKKATEQAVAERKTDDTPAAARWYIRMGSFSKEANAMALKDKLRKQGYPAVLDVVTTADKGKLYRLRVGPESNKDLAEKNRQKLDNENSSSSILELE